MMSEAVEINSPVVVEKPAAPADDIKENGDRDSDAKLELVASDKDLVEVKPPTPIPEPAPEENQSPKEADKETEKEEEEEKEKEPETEVEQPVVKEDADDKPTENSENAATEEPVTEKKETKPVAEEKEAAEDQESPKKKRKRPSNENEVESESDEEKVGMLEVNPVIEDGVKRARKKVERLSDVLDKTLAKEEKAKAKDLLPDGRGVPLGEIEYIKTMIGKSRGDELKLIHVIIFNRMGVHNQIKANLRRFKGFDFNAESSDYKKKLQRLQTRKISDLKGALKILGLDMKGFREDLATRLLDFLMKPDESAVTAKISPNKGGAKKKKTASKKRQSSDKASKSKSKKKDVDKDEDSNDDSMDEDEEQPPKKSRSKGPKAVKPKAPAKKKAPKKRKTAELPVVSEDSDDRQSDSDSGPASKKAKKMPTDEELKKTILGLLENVDLEKVTMKNVLHQIYEKYEGLDLTHKKEYLKSVVKDILSN